MTVTQQFLLQMLAASALLCVWVGLPGLVVLRLLGWQRRFGWTLGALLAPVLGYCSFVPISLAVSSLHYNRALLLITWSIFNLAGYFLGPKHGGPAPRHRGAAWLFVGCALVGALTAQNLLPRVRDGRMFLGPMLFDHEKVAISDAIARQGLPPVNPYYAPRGRNITLGYYYLWHFAASQAQVLTRLTHERGLQGWPCDVALTWLTMAAAVALAVALAVELTGRTLAGWFVLLMAASSQIGDPLIMRIWGPGAKAFLGPPLLVTLWQQAAWAPHHVIAACAIVLMLLLLAEIVHQPTVLSRAALLGLASAAAVGSSYWVGGVALAAASPLILVALLWARLSGAQWRKLLMAACVAAPVAVAMAFPVIYTLLVTPKMSRRPVEFRIWHTSDWVGPIWWQLPWYWLVILPLTMGVAAVLGFAALIARRRGEPSPQRTFRLLAGWTSLGFFLVTQLLASRVVENRFGRQGPILQNDLGWRAPIVALILLGIWASAALTELWPRRQLPEHWQPRAVLIRCRAALVPLAWLGLILGLASTVVFYLPPTAARPEHSAQIAERETLAAMPQAWADVRQVARPDDRVQANPDAFLPLVSPGQLPGALLSDRPTAYASEHAIRDFAFAYDLRESHDIRDLVRRIFAGKPDPADVQRLRDQLKVRVILVTDQDGVWKSDALDNSGLFRRVLNRDKYRIYLATRIPARAPTTASAN